VDPRESLLVHGIRPSAILSAAVRARSIINQGPYPEYGWSSTAIGATPQANSWA